MVLNSKKEKEFKMEIIQVLLYVLMATIVLGFFICSIAVITALKNGDKERASKLIGDAIVGLGSTLIVLMIMLILIYYFKL